MPLTVRAQVVDIRADTPKDSDRFLVDTNVWYWLYYPPASSTARSYQVLNYPAYIKKAIKAKSSLHCCALNFAELAHNIEQAEREIHGASIGQKIKPKAFRHDACFSSQYAKIVTLIADTWADICNVSTLLDLTMDSAFMQSATTLFPSVGLDGYDLFMAEMALHSGISQIITDDGDFATVPGITLFTANQRVVQDAKAAKKLLVR